MMRVVPSLEERIADLYHEITRWRRDIHPQGRGSARSLADRPPLFKAYPRSLETIPLPDPAFTGGMPLWQSLRSRRSRRFYVDEPISLQDVSQLIWAADGISEVKGKNMFRTAPSGGLRYPIETYLVANNVDGLLAGIYHYDVRRHGLKPLKTGDFGEQLLSIGLERSIFRNAAAVIVLTAVIGRSKWCYHELAYWLAWIEAGHIMQNVYLAATALRLGSCAVGAFYGNEMDDLLEIDAEKEASLYVGTVGRVKDMKPEEGELLDRGLVDRYLVGEG